jgi:hypothetical protein
VAGAPFGQEESFRASEWLEITAGTAPEIA